MGFFDIYFGVIFLVMGTVLGSFFNVVIYRMPRDKSVIHPPSSCPNCGHMIRWFENIPVLSYLFLGGKCSNCKQKISIRYPLVEMFTGLFSLMLYLFFYHEIIFTPGLSRWDLIPHSIQYISLMLFIPISAIDIEHFIIPNEFTIGGFILGLLVSFVPGGITPLQSVIGVAAGAGILIVFGKIGQLMLKREDTMGWGDIKMLAWFGALFGPWVALGSIFIGAFVGLAGSIVMLILKKMKKGEHLPFGPYLCTGALLTVLWGKEILFGYCALFGIDATLLIK